MGISFLAKLLKCKMQGFVCFQMMKEYVCYFRLKSMRYVINVPNVIRGMSLMIECQIVYLRRARNIQFVIRGMSLMIECQIVYF